MKSSIQLYSTTFIVAIMIAFFGGGAYAATQVSNKVVVYNWSEYIPQSVLDDFTKETGINVVYSTFESNEAMIAKVRLMKGKGYDIVVPSSYFIESMAEAGLLQEINLKKLPNIGNIDTSWLDQNFDKGNRFSVPYMWGAVGLGYNKKYIPEGSIVKWTDLLKSELKGKIILTDDLRDAFGLALKATGHSTNASSEEAIKEAYEFLLKLKSSVRIFDVTATKQTLITEEVWIGPIWNGDFLVAVEENENLAFVFPEEGAILWMDNFVIPSGAENIENAHTFINFMLRPDVAKRCVEEFKYSTPNFKALDLLTEEERANPILVPTATELKGAEFPETLGSVIRTYQKYWEMLKTTR